MRTRLVALLTAAVAVLLLGLAGCGGGGSGTGSGLAGLAQPGTLVFVEGTIRPAGKLKASVDRAAATVGGIDNLGEFIVEKLEESAREDGQAFDYATEVEPWLGDRAAVAFEKLEDGDLSDPLVAIESSDASATQRFIDRQAERSRDPYRDGSYEGVDYRVGGSEGNAIGIVDEYLVIANDERAFRGAVDASQGESLADADRFDAAISAATAGSLADAYVDVGGVLKQSGDEISAQALPILRGAGIDPSDATAVASVVPGGDLVEVDLSSDLGGEESPGGDASALLGSLPAESFAAFGVSGFGGELQEALDSLDASGIPGQVPPHQLKKSLKAAGIDLDLIAGSLGDAGVYAIGSGKSSLGGALILTTEDPGQAASTVSSLGLLLRGAGTPGVTAVTGKASGFSIHSEELGDKPLAIVAKGDRIAVGYGLAQTLRGLSSSGTLSESSVYDEAVTALGKTPISGFVDGPAALRLANALVPSSEQGFREAVPYLRHIRSIAIGSGREGNLATAKLIVSLGK